ncbi:hypothetical protein EYF80_043195 [Liparis tanakae]|uniref:Uncharacterized protein n=1 Tax=Liparis tanakae TaxID=230148 RepID=A0A4Z2FZ63_9TELE|nr:hypothetical protein EYF80_043195 [Liparis tanakae]
MSDSGEEEEGLAARVSVLQQVHGWVTGPKETVTYIVSLKETNTDQDYGRQKDKDLDGRGTESTRRRATAVRRDTSTTERHRTTTERQKNYKETQNNFIDKKQLQRDTK